MQTSFPVHAPVLSVRPPELASALRTLSDAKSDNLHRQAAAALVIRELAKWGPMVIRKRYGIALEELSQHSVVADALQHTAVVAATTLTPFQGEDDPAARSWLRRILLNFVADELRRTSAARKRSARHEPSEQVSVPDSEVSCWTHTLAADLPEEAVEELTRAVEFLRQLRDSMRAAHRGRDAESLLRASFIYVAHLSGMPTDEQLRLLGFARTGQACVEAKRAHDQVYQMRRRGRTAIVSALSRMRGRESDGGNAA